MGWIEYYKPVIVMLVLQFTYAALSVSARASLLQGLSPRVFVFYRQAFGTLFITPIAYFFRTKTKNSSMGWKSFSLIFIAALIGVTGNQMIQYEGMYLASSSAASALANIIPAITFVAASIVGYITKLIYKLSHTLSYFIFILDLSQSILEASEPLPKY